METEADEAMKEYCLLAYFPWHAQFAIKPRTTKPRVAQPTMAWDLSHQSLMKKIPQSDLQRHFFQLRLPSL